MHRFPPSALLSLLCFPATLSAQSGPTTGPLQNLEQQDPTPPGRFYLDFGSQYETGDASPAGPGGDIFRNSLTVPFAFPLGKDWKILGVTRGTHSDFSSDPFGGGGMETWKVSLLALVDGSFSDTWSMTGGFIGGASWEDGASFSDSLTGGSLAVLNYRFSPSLKVGLGAVYLSRLNEDALVVPMLGLDWKVSDAVKVTLYGLDLRAEYEFSSRWSVYLRGEFDPDGALFEERKGNEADSYSDQGIRAAGGVRWSPGAALSLSLEGGVAFHEYTLRNAREEILSKDRLDPAPFVGITARVFF